MCVQWWMTCCWLLVATTRADIRRKNFYSCSDSTFSYYLLHTSSTSTSEAIRFWFVTNFSIYTKQCLALCLLHWRGCTSTKIKQPNNKSRDIERNKNTDYSIITWFFFSALLLLNSPFFFSARKKLLLRNHTLEKFTDTCDYAVYVCVGARVCVCVGECLLFISELALCLFKPSRLTFIRVCMGANVALTLGSFCSSCCVCYYFSTLLALSRYYLPPQLFHSVFLTLTANVRCHFDFFQPLASHTQSYNFIFSNNFNPLVLLLPQWAGQLNIYISA